MPYYDAEIVTRFNELTQLVINDREAHPHADDELMQALDEEEEEAAAAGVGALPPLMNVAAWFAQPAPLPVVVVQPQAGADAAT